MQRMVRMSILAVAALVMCVTCQCADFNGFDRGSGYEPVEPAYYPEFEGLFEKRPIDAFAGFDEKKAAYLLSTAPGKVYYNGKNIFVSIDEYEAGYAHFYLTHILVRDVSQVRVGQSFDTFGGERETASSYASRTGAAVVVNGSYFYYETNKPIDICAPVVIRDGQIVREGVSNGSELCLRADGTFFSPHPVMDFTGTDLLNLGVIGSLGTADPLLIQDGTPMSFPNGVNDFTYPRTGVGAVFPGEYYIITAGGPGYDRGLSYRQMQRLFFDLECSFARSLDGGGSVSLVVGGELVNTPAEGKERPVVDFLVFDP